jgi:hypothetical protein
LKGHVLVVGCVALAEWPRRSGWPRRAECECGEKSPRLKTIAERRAWHREHKNLVKIAQPQNRDK